MMHLCGIGLSPQVCVRSDFLCSKYPGREVGGGWFSVIRKPKLRGAWKGNEWLWRCVCVCASQFLKTWSRNQVGIDRACVLTPTREEQIIVRCPESFILNMPYISGEWSCGWHPSCNARGLKTQWVETALLFNREKKYSGGVMAMQ